MKQNHSQNGILLSFTLAHTCHVFILNGQSYGGNGIIF